MMRYDRLSSLMTRFEMRIADAEPGTGNLLILGDAATGAPITAVTIPMGNSAGAMMLRAIRSASNNSVAPKRAAFTSR